MAVSVTIPAILDDVLTLLALPFLLASACWLLLHYGWPLSGNNTVLLTMMLNAVPAGTVMVTGTFS